MATRMVEVEVEAEAVVEAMREDGPFCIDILFELAMGLHQGLLRDNIADLAQNSAGQNDWQFVVIELRAIAEVIEGRIADE